MDVVDEPGPAEVAQAKEDYTRALGVLEREGHRRKRLMVGQCFKVLEQRDEQNFPVYVAVAALEQTKLTGWYFFQAPSGAIELRPDADIQAAYLGQHGVEIPRGEFVAAFNEILTALARYASRIPVP